MKNVIYDFAAVSFLFLFFEFNQEGKCQENDWFWTRLSEATQLHNGAWVAALLGPLLGVRKKRQIFMSDTSLIWHLKGWLKYYIKDSKIFTPSCKEFLQEDFEQDFQKTFPANMSAENICTYFRENLKNTFYVKCCTFLIHSFSFSFIHFSLVF